MKSLLKPLWARAVGLFASALMMLALAPPVSGQSKLPPPSTLKKLSVEELMDIEVTSVSKRPEKLSSVASAIQVVSADDIRRAGASSLPEALRLAPNLEVAQIDSRQWAITARGFNNVFADKLLVLIDGRTVYTPLYAGVYWDVQDTMLEDLDRIEVISGPGATQWGANAVNGVINITTKPARETQGALVFGGGGRPLRDFGGVRYGGQLSAHGYYRVYAKYFDRGDVVRPNGRPSEDSWRFGQTGFRADWELDAGSALTVQGDAYDGKEGQIGPLVTRVNGANLLGRWSRTLAEHSELKLQLYYDHTHRRNLDAFTQDLDTYDLDFQHRFLLGGANNIVWGAGYRVVDDAIINTPQNAFLPPNATREWFSAFAQDEIALSQDRLHVTLGSKIEHSPYTGVEFQPGVRAAWRLEKNHTLWSAVSRALRTPSRIDRDLFSPATPPYRVAGGRSVSEKLLAYELGYRAELDPRLALAVSTFYHDYDDLRSLEPLSPPARFPVEANTGLRGHSAGAELTLDWNATEAWRLHAGYVELRAHSERQPGRADRSTMGSIARDANHRFLLRSLWDISSRWECDATVRAVSAIGYQAVPGYAEADLRIAFRPRADWELSLTGQNLLHKRHAEFNSLPGRRDIERGAYAKAECHF